MTQPISSLVNDEMYCRMMGVDKTRPGSCDKHGDFIEMHCSGAQRSVPAGWKGCPTCNDEAVQKRQEQERHQRQLEMHTARIEGLVKKSGIPARFMGKTFENFEVVNPKAKSHLAKVRAYADVVAGKDHEGRCLLMLGKVGNGKTHLGCALLAHLIRETGTPSYYWTFSDLVRSVKASFSKGADHSEQDVYDDFARGRLVVLDEVGMQNFTDFEQAVAYEAINVRYLAERPTVLISNLQAVDLPVCVGERAVDRLREGGGKALDFDWTSYRVGGAS